MTATAHDKHWRIADLPWAALNPAVVDADLLKVIKAAALVEYNASVYADYLKKIFHDDPAFCIAADRWAVEEVQHGEALGAWAEKIDPSWSMEDAMKRFRDGYTPEHFINGASNSVRGSRSGEMVARCMVETGTSSYYSAIGEATTEPVLQEICKHIAADEFKHYKLFYDTLHKYLDSEKLSRVKRLKIALGRIAESEDDELSYAFYAANEPATTT
ncbi:MAG: ferritin-like domain-containing protein, partial [Alphaproteobacteria bacterium]|nr:ferritin-like domain-containing protein [Alphaproteobacteria bacterium]